ncbi:MAG: SIR2 family protein [Ferrovibrio sp.]|uniref:SIR2 family protein n=1 Tax=Ferrovibrio sp. TaxID=1917215 RepID=UPI00391B899C
MTARDDGNVVFFCGAGVSFPAGLPDFYALAQKVISRLGSPADSKSRMLLKRISEDREYAPPLDQVFTLLQQDYGSAEVEDIVSKLLKTPAKVKLDQHKTILRLSRNAARDLQLVTTNFDLLFERADKTVRTYSPPNLPDLSSGHPFEGLVYLHGRRSDQPAGRSTKRGLVLSSADFGRAYLADGWATRFVRELLRRYIIVLVGYSATDPPVRYLLEGLHARGDQKTASIYAFDQGDEGEVSARWRDRGVTPLAYPRSDKAHSALWNTLRAWADRADDYEGWCQSVIQIAGRGPRNLLPHERGQVVSLIRSPAGARLFANSEPIPPADWLCVFDRLVRYQEPLKPILDKQGFDPLVAYGLDDDPPRPPNENGKSEQVGEDFLSPLFSDEKTNNTRLAGMQPRMPVELPARLHHIAWWFGKSLNDPTTAWWAAGYLCLHPVLLDRINWWLEQHGDSLHKEARQVWSLLAEMYRLATRHDDDYRWFEFARKLKNWGWENQTLREFDHTVAPRLTAKRPWDQRHYPPNKDWSELQVRSVVDFDVTLPARSSDKIAIPKTILPQVIVSMRRSLELAASLLSDINPPYWRTTTFDVDMRNRRDTHINDTNAFLLWFVSLYDRYCKEYPAKAKAEVGNWPDSEKYFFNKLKIYVWRQPKIFSAAEATSGLLGLSDEGFWEFYHQRELLHTLRERWARFSRSDRLLIEQRVLKGPPRWLGEKKRSYEQRRLIRSAALLGWLLHNGCALSPSTKKILPVLRKADPRWNPSWDIGADDAHEPRGGWIKTDSDPSRILNVPLRNLIEQAKRSTERPFAEFISREPFRGLVEQRPFRAFSALSYEARKKRYDVRLWGTALSYWPEGTSDRLLLSVGSRICGLPDSIFLELRYAIPAWCGKFLPDLAKNSRSRALIIWDSVVERFLSADETATSSSLGDTLIGGTPLNLSRRTYDHALNGPIGQMTGVLLKILSDLDLKRDAGIPIEFQDRLAALFKCPGEGADHAISTVTAHLLWLNHIDHAWVKRTLVPLFDVNNKFSEPAWNGHLHAAVPPEPKLFGLLKKDFLKLFSFIQTWKWRSPAGEHLHHFLVIGCLWGQRERAYISYSEARSALQATTDEGRSQVVWFLAHRVEIEDKWKAFIKPFLLRAWPLEARFRTPQVSRALASLLEDAGNDFPDIVETIIPLMAAVENFDVFLHRLKDEDNHPAKDFPEATLALLHRMVPDDPRHAPYDLGVILDLIGNARPDLMQDYRWQRLKSILSRR